MFGSWQFPIPAVYSDTGKHLSGHGTGREVSASLLSPGLQSRLSEYGATVGDGVGAALRAGGHLLCECAGPGDVPQPGLPLAGLIWYFWQNHPGMTEAVHLQYMKRYRQR